MSNRRTFLQLAFTGLLAGLLQPTHRAQGQARATLKRSSPREGLTLVEGAGGNVLLLAAGGAGVLIDSGAPEFANELSSAVRDVLGETKLAAVLNTHWHPDHTGGNDIFVPAAATAIAHENTRLWMSTEYYVDWEDKTYAPRAAAALPTATFYSSDPQPIRLDLADERIEYGHLREAHTDGDIYVYLRSRNVLVAGGAVSAGAYPVIDYATGGWIRGLIDSTEKLLSITNGDTLIVPAEGPVQPRAHLEAQLDMLRTVYDRLANLMRKGRSIEEMLAADVTAGFDAAWGDNRERFVANIYNGLWWAGRLDGSL